MVRRQTESVRIFDKEFKTVLKKVFKCAHLAWQRVAGTFEHVLEGRCDMAKRFTLGIEEEFQLVDPQSGKLCSCAQSILEKGAPIFEEHIKPEMLQSTLEFVSDILPDIASARRELYTARTLLA